MLRTGMALVQSMVTGLAQQQVLHARMGDPFYEVVNYWTHAPRQTIKFNDRGTERTIQFAFAHQSWIHNVMPGEKLGFYMGDMMILNSDLLQTHPDWVPYVVLKLYGERFVEEGLDRSGIKKHYESLFVTIRVAHGHMETDAFRGFVQELLRHDRDGYFEWDEAATRFLDGYSDTEQAQRAYLGRHHDNRWVARGRMEEAIAALGAGSVAIGRNHAEAIADLIRFERDGALLYGAAMLVHALAHLEDGESLLINPPLNAVAYLLTQDANGLRNLVVFRPNTQPETDVISLADRKARRTLVALSKRLGYEIMGVEKKVHLLVEQSRASLDSMAVRMSQINTSIETEMAQVGLALRAQDNTTALAIIDSMEQRGLPAGLDALQKEIARAQGNLSDLEQLKAALRKAV